MNTQINELHSKAMAIAEAAFVAKRKGSFEEAKRLSEKAFEYEHNAALLLQDEFKIEPTRSILFRSAACLALDAGKFIEAENMINCGLQGNPPTEIKTELQELLFELPSLNSIEKSKNQCATPVLGKYHSSTVKIRNWDRFKNQKHLRLFIARKKLKARRSASVIKNIDYHAPITEKDFNVTDFDAFLQNFNNSNNKI